MRLVRIEELMIEIGCDRSLLEELREAGLFESEELPLAEADELRVAAEWMRSLGVNAPGVDVALQLRRRLLVLEERTARLLRALLEESER